jgi:hypothetical protein
MLLSEPLAAADDDPPHARARLRPPRPIAELPRYRRTRRRKSRVLACLRRPSAYRNARLRRARPMASSAATTALTSPAPSLSTIESWLRSMFLSSKRRSAVSATMPITVTAALSVNMPDPAHMPIAVTSHSPAAVVSPTRWSRCAGSRRPPESPPLPRPTRRCAMSLPRPGRSGRSADSKRTAMTRPCTLPQPSPQSDEYAARLGVDADRARSRSRRKSCPTPNAQQHVQV